jgi:hypothetical protein
VREYTSTDRDSLLATVLDGVRASGNRDVFIKMESTERGFRIGSFSQLIDEEVESLHLKSLQTLPEGSSFNEMMTRFNVNIPYSGIINAVTQDVSALTTTFFHKSLFQGLLMRLLPIHRVCLLKIKRSLYSVLCLHSGILMMRMHRVRHLNNSFMH